MFTLLPCPIFCLLTSTSWNDRPGSQPHRPEFLHLQNETSDRGSSRSLGLSKERMKVRYGGRNTYVLCFFQNNMVQTYPNPSSSALWELATRGPGAYILFPGLESQITANQVA